MNNGFLRVAAATPEIRVADPAYNATQIVNIAKKAAKEHVEVLAFPELCITGYTCGDLFFQKELTDAAERALRRIADGTKALDMFLFVGLPVRHGGKLYNVCAAVKGGKILGAVPKTYLPEYNEFCEVRFFSPCPEDADSMFLAGEVCTIGQQTFRIADNIDIGVDICEDVWASVPPSSQNGALICVNLSASSELVGKPEKRRTLVMCQSLRNRSAYIYVDAGRGESTTDLVFSGHNIIAEKGTVLAENKPFENNVLTVADIDTDLLLCERAKVNTVRPSKRRETALRPDEEVLLPEWQDRLRRPVSRLPFVPHRDESERAELMLHIQTEGLRKRMEHTGCKKLVLGVSGGLDSALALLVCLRALDALKLPRKNLVALSLPGFGTSEQTAQNALSLAKAAGADHRTVNICESVRQHLHDIGHDGVTPDVTYENAQARMRTLILMDIANRENGLCVGTGDLSEAALGWCTYGGDHMSMYAVNASIPKTTVKFLAAYEAERLGGAMQSALDGVLGTDISPELLPAKDGAIAQKTEDILGKYELNDFFLYYAIRGGSSPQKTLLYAAAAFGGKPQDYAPALVKFYKRFFASQFKRSCSPDGAKVGFSFSPRGDWHMPSDASVNAWIESIQNKDGDIQ